MCEASRTQKREPAYRVRTMYTPTPGAGAEMLDGGAAEVAERIVAIVREKLV